MKNLSEYINESQNTIYEAKKPNDSGKDASARIEEIKTKLQNSRLPDYVKTIDEILDEMKDEPKLKKLLVDGFGGDLGDIKLTMNEELIDVSELLPTQNEIDITKSLDYVLKWPAPNLEKYFANEVELGEFPLVTWNSQFIIDGHHRWSQVRCINPKAEMKCYNYTGKGLSPVDILKATQGSIGAVIADETNDNTGDDSGHLPKANAKKGTNIYSDEDFDKEGNDFAKYIKEKATPEFYKLLKKYVNKRNKEFKVEKLKTDEDCIKYVVKNLISMRAKNPIYSPSNGSAAERTFMPQTDNGGTAGGENTQKDKTKRLKSAKPDAEGSALNRLKKGFSDDLI